MRKGEKMSDEQKAKIGAANSGKPGFMRGRQQPEETKAKIRASLLGHRHTEESKARMRGPRPGVSSWNKGKSSWAKGLAPWNKGVPVTEQVKAKIKASFTEERRAELSVAATEQLKFRGGRRDGGFRSGWERKVAEWMTSQGWDWRYEEKTYMVGARRYTPDFHVYQNGQLWKIIEVKGHWWKGRGRVDEFTAQYPELPFEIWEGLKLKQLGIL